MSSSVREAGTDETGEVEEGPAAVVRENVGEGGVAKAPLGRREWNEMEKNEKNHFRIFFSSLVWEF